MSDLEFAAHIANLKAGGVDALRAEDRSASQTLAQQARDAEAQIDSLQDNLPDTYDGYSLGDLREAMDYDEDLQKYVTAGQTRDQNFNHALVADTAEHAKHEPSHNEARAFLTRQRAAELKRYQPSAIPERLQQYIDGEERNVAAQAIVL